MWYNANMKREQKGIGVKSRCFFVGGNRAARRFLFTRMRNFRSSASVLSGA